MIRRVRVTIRVGRACRPHRIRTFVAKIVQALCLASASSNQALPFQVLLIVRRKRDRGRPGHDDGQCARGRAPAAARSGPQHPRPDNPGSTSPRRCPGGLPGHSDAASPGRSTVGRQGLAGSPPRGPSRGTGTPPRGYISARGGEGRTEIHDPACRIGSSRFRCPP
ncbi:tumor suppressor ARF-like isoform X1 [Trichosurus vulpecula]|uniref:tumor suppressor ARF-like isoform X1 n=1 Tax=Trichosurus vulpecula TaxID=9337 RepID=UPI00186AC80C|nr:tumor suppressor ARF-like isoform X1 [Trichosurus vulpecula]